MVTIAVVWFSGYGHTARLAEAVIEGAREGATVVSVRIPEDGQISEADWAALNDADSIIYGSPTYMGTPAWQFARFSQESSKIWAKQGWKDKIAGGFTVSASVVGDKGEVIGTFMTLSQQHGQLWVGVGDPPSNTKAHGPEDVNWTAGFSGVMAIAPADAGPYEAPRAGDLETARRYGARIATIAARFAG